MRIYVDFDDCLCETGRAFSKLVLEMFNKHVPEVSIITGRPSSVYEPSRIWLDEHGLKNVRLYCLNKYGRDHFWESIRKIVTGE